jgi:hypothetical protein
VTWRFAKLEDGKKAVAFTMPGAVTTTMAASDSYVVLNNVITGCITGGGVLPKVTFSAVDAALMLFARSMVLALKA